MHHVQRAGLVSQVTTLLRAEVLEGRWPVGSRIPTEPELVDRTGVGRNTVREAVQALVHAGLLERRQGSGTYVIADSELVGALGRHLSAADHRDVLELRQAIDVAAAELAAARRTEDDLAVLLQAAEERRSSRSQDDDAATGRADLALHRAVVAASRNPLLLSVYDSLAGVLEASITANVAEIDDKFDEVHEELVQAVVDQDPEQAAAASRQLLSHLLERRGV